MIKQMQKKLTLYASIFVSVIFLIVSVIYIFFTYKSNELENTTKFSDDVNNIYTSLSEYTIIKKTLFSQYTSNDYQIYITQNGKTICYESPSAPADYITAISEVNDIASTEYNFPNGSEYKNETLKQVSFYYETENRENYYAGICHFTSNDENVFVTVLYSTAGNQIKFLKTCGIFVLSALLITLILCIFIYFFVGKVLEPVEEARIRQMNFVASASHELRTPLTVIMSSISAMRMSSPEEFNQHAEMAVLECNNMSNLIEDMLNLSKFDNHTLDISYSKCHIEDIIIDCYNHFDTIISEKGIDFNVELPDEILPEYNIDKNRVLQVLNILTDNAISYTNNGSITLIACETYDSLKISVRDTGVGIPDCDKPYIFDRFYSVDKSHTDKQHYGLGLSIAKEIMDAHEARIEVTDTEGGGTTFTLIFPVNKFRV